MPRPTRTVSVALLLSACLVVLSATGAQAAKSKPNLKASGVSSATTWVRSATVTVTATVKNAGKSGAKATTTELVLSKDAKRSTGDLVLKRVSTAKIAKGTKRTVTFSVKVPASLALGSRRVLVCADAKKKVKESSESDNCSVRTKAITITAPAVRPPAPKPKPKPTPDPKPPVPPAEGRSGGALSVCEAGHKIEVPETPKTQWHLTFSASPLLLTADPVGDFDPGTKTTYTITNTGGSATPLLSVDALACTGVPNWGSLFSRTGSPDLCPEGPFALAPQESCTAEIYVADQTIAGVHQGYVVVTVPGEDDTVLLPVTVTVPAATP